MLMAEVVAATGALPLIGEGDSACLRQCTDRFRHPADTIGGMNGYAGIVRLVTSFTMSTGRLLPVLAKTLRRCVFACSSRR